MHEFIPATDADRQAMLDAIGADSIEDLFASIPDEIKARFESLDLPALTELETRQKLKALASENANPDQYVSFMGGGLYDHDVPSAVGHLLMRQEFLTCYTPYQAELSQGTLTWMFEFQSMVCELTGMEVANSSMYDGASALAEALLMAERVTKQKRFAIAKSLNPAYRQVLSAFGWAREFEFIEIPFDPETGQLNRTAIQQAAQEPLAGLIVQSPNFTGIIEDLNGLKDMIGDAFLVVSSNPMTLGLLAPPGEFGADIVVCEGQSLGHAPNFGGPMLGMFATRKQYIRQMPGRLAGQTVDKVGKTGYVMTLQAREQHIRRAKATSNICTNQALLALGTTIYLSLIGKHGLRQQGELNAQKAHYLSRELNAAGIETKFNGPFLNEFVIQVPDPQSTKEQLQAKGFMVLGADTLQPLGIENGLLLTVTEKRTRAELDQLVSALKEA